MIAFFGVPDDRSFDDAEGHLRPWPIAGGTRLWAGPPDDGVQRIGIQKGKTIVLQLTGIRGGRIQINPEGPVQLKPFEGAADPAVATSDKYKFKLSAVADGLTSLSAVDAGKTQAKLDVVVGNFEKDPSMEIDLMAKIGQGDDSLKIHALQSMLNNRWTDEGVFTVQDNLFEQNSPANFNQKFKNLTCGFVSVYRARQVFGIPPLGAGDDWYRRPIHERLHGKTLAKRDDVKYKPEKITALIAKIVAALKKDLAVPVAVLDDPVGMQIDDGKLIAYNAGGHSVIIVGCNHDTNQFLYIDPWGGGSHMEYKGGIAANRVPGKCVHLGLFDVINDPDRRFKPSDISANLIRGSASTEFTFNLAKNNFLEVVSARL